MLRLITSLSVVVVLSMVVAALDTQESDNPTEPPVQASETTPAVEDQLATIQGQLDSGEPKQAVDAVRAIIASIESERSYYDELLIQPLLLLGDGERLLGNYPSALEAYDRALGITQQTHGLWTVEQIDTVKREAETYYELGHIGRANDRYEYIFTVFNHLFEPFSTDLLPSVFELADWYVKIYNIYAARGLYEYAKQVVETHADEHDADYLRALRGIATTYRLERFRPPTTLPQMASPPPRLYWANEQPYVYHAEVNDFAEGEKVLIEVVRIELARPTSTVESQTNAKLQLADWFTLFDKGAKANAVYLDVLQSFQEGETPTFVTQAFSEPVLLYNPLPRDPEPQPGSLEVQAIQAEVTYKLDIDSKGRVSMIDLVDVQYDSEYVKLFTQRIGRAIYRPKFVDGKAVERHAVPFKHSYIFYEELEEN